ncbi:CpsB/CapC family capsule biosynthesis tyrosine phosphatase [Faecalicatena contorta]|uniref:CpsB/CapC family capsule biosynthesis tyrosine phosphatase n=1 Tax=Faecalicatena contorta TaxID=39482 RepID=UPI001F3C06E2|nr:CpsB/CapC family capsule biosynthesis tyrosine phosphatase [Faecalicatena contorta]MCF2684125.1 protein tyrosine phosphatase [Faecalicatena contorta]
MDGFIDMHCHILSGVDDGAKDSKEMMKMLKIAYSEGIRCIIATPHHHPVRGQECPEILRRQAVLLRDAAHAIDEKFRIYLGSEIYFGQDVTDKIKAKQILTMNRRDIVLLEFSPSDSFDYIKQGLQQVRFGGYQVILAHVERYICMIDHPEYAKELYAMGIYLQVNADSIIGNRRIRKYVKWLMDEELVYCVGTDAHNAKNRAPYMRKAAAYVAKNYGEEYMRRIFFSNAKEMLKKVRKDESK